MVENVKKHIHSGKLCQLPCKKFKPHVPINTFFYHAAFIEKNFFSKALKHLMIEQHSGPPPGLLTRVRDGVETFDAEDVMKSFKKLLKEKLPLSLKALQIEFINRTLCSRNKLFKFKIAESPMCSKCHTIADTEHCIYFCDFPSFCAKKIAIYLDVRFHNGVPHVQLAMKKLFLYNIYIEELDPRIAGQIMNLILNLKKSYLAFAAEEKWLNWGTVVYYAQLFSHIRKTITQRIFVDLEVNLLNDLLIALTEDFTHTMT